MARMFSPSNESSNVDIKDESDPTVRYRGLLIQSLQRLHCQVHPTLTASADALDYVESLILRLLGTLCVSRTHTTQDVEERVAKTFPKPLDHVAIRDAHNALERWQNVGTLRKSPGHGLTLPVEKLHVQIRELIGHKVEMAVSLFVCAVLEYIARDILKLTGNYVKNIHHIEVTLQDCRVAMCADAVLDELFCFTGEDWAERSIEGTQEVPLEKTYPNQLNDLITDEREHIRNLQLIIKVFRHALQNQVQSQALTEEEAEHIFGNIEDVLEFSAALASTFEDVLEITEENQQPALGSYFYEMAEGYEFDVYETYATHVADPNCMKTLNAVLERPAVQEALQRSSQGFWLAAKYVLPRLLWTPVFHYFYLFEVIRNLQGLAITDKDRDDLEQTQGVLGPHESLLANYVNQAPLKKNQEGLFFRRRSCSRVSASQKLSELSRCVDGWAEFHQREISQTCQEFIMEGPLLKASPGNKRPTERHAFLFDGLICLCKPASALSRSRNQPERESYKLKEKFFIRKIEVSDKADSEELKNAFEIICRHDGGNNTTCQSIVLIAKSIEDKEIWLASLVAVNMRSYLERSLDSILSAEEKQNPLRLPPKEKYKFSEPDSPSNIIFEEKSTGGVPLIKGATLIKLVERLTFHMYADPSFVRTFLTTYRSFCDPKKLLSLLIDRYNIPEIVEETSEALAAAAAAVAAASNSPDQQQMAKRFRKEYQQPVKIRVLNVIRHWIEHHYYDFERDDELLKELKLFLDSMLYDSRNGKNMKKWIESITKAIQRKYEQQGTTKEHTFSHEAPPIEWWLVREPDRFDLLTLHPIEVARQLTLLEFDHYRAVQPSELVNAAWTKKDKHITSPNLLKIIHHSSNFAFYLEKLIVECQNFEERVAVVSRCIEIMVVLQELNNFTGVFAISSALQSAPVHRLEHTHAAIRSALRKALEDVLDLQSVHGRKYQERLRSINPPCVPFLGMYLTNILHIEEGNPDSIIVEGVETELINFSKRRKVAEITGEIQQYQNQPYNLTVEKDIRAFLEQLAPEVTLSEKELNDYLYQCSLQIEPRGARQPIKAGRKWPELSLKSPGIKTSRTTSRFSVSSSTNSMNPAAFISGLNHHHHHHHHHHQHHHHRNHFDTNNHSTSASNSQTPSSLTTSPNPPHSPEEQQTSATSAAAAAAAAILALPSTPTSPPSSAGDIHVPVLVPMLDPAPAHSSFHPQHTSSSLSLTQQQSVPPAPVVVHRRQHSHPATLAGVFFPSSPSSPHQQQTHGPPRFSFPDATAPPLPPRTRRDDSTSPALPPRGATQSESPPPLPPRKPHTSSTAASAAASASATASCSSSVPSASPPAVLMPLLPPKTHKPRPPPLVLHQSNTDSR